MNMIFMNRHLKPKTMLKKRLHLRRFLTCSTNNFITTTFETLANYFANFWMTASRSFIIELTEIRFFLLRLVAFKGVAL